MYLPPSDAPLFRGRYRVPSARRPGHDYQQAGAYFITICTAHRAPHFGAIEWEANDPATAHLVGTALADQAVACWLAMPAHFPFAVPDAFVVMPDHIHGVVWFERPADFVAHSPARFGPQSNNLAAVVRGFKVGVKAWATRSGVPFEWQARYHDRIIRNDDELRRIQHYIAQNQARWATESGNPDGIFR